MGKFDATLLEKRIKEQMAGRKSVEGYAFFKDISINMDSSFVKEAISKIEMGNMNTINWLDATEEDLDEFEKIIDNLSGCYFSFENEQTIGLGEYCNFVDNLMRIRPDSEELFMMIFF